jgi:hypothetical protein
MSNTKTTDPTVLPRQETGDELRAQYLACSYLVSACEQALDRMGRLRKASAGRSYVPVRALELMQAIRDDWCAALREVARLTADAE